MTTYTLSAFDRVSASLRYLALPLLLLVGYMVAAFSGKVAIASNSYMGMSDADIGFGVALLLISIVAGYLGKVSYDMADYDNGLGRTLRTLMSICLIPAVLAGVAMMIMLGLAMSMGNASEGLLVLVAIPLAIVPVAFAALSNW